MPMARTHLSFQMLRQSLLCGRRVPISKKPPSFHRTGLSRTSSSSHFAQGQETADLRVPVDRESISGYDVVPNLEVVRKRKWVKG